MNERRALQLQAQQSSRKVKCCSLESILVLFHVIDEMLVVILFNSDSCVKRHAQSAKVLGRGIIRFQVDAKIICSSGLKGLKGNSHRGHHE